MPAVRTVMPPLAILGLLAGVAYALRSQLARALPGRRASSPDRYRCDCGRLLRVTGQGRHRIYFDGDDALLDPACPGCSRPLPSA